MNEEITKLCVQERAFLHEISNPLGTAFFVVDSVADIVKSISDPSAALALDQIEQIRKALDKVNDLLRARRQVLIQASDA